MDYNLSYNPYRNNYEVNDYPMSNIRYDGDRFKVNANVTSNGILCFVGGAAVGALIAYYLLKKNNNKQ